MFYTKTKMASSPPDLLQRSTQEMLLPKKLDFPLKGCWANWCVDFIEWIHCKLEGMKEYIYTFTEINGANFTNNGRKLTFMYKSYTSLKKFLIPSSCRTSWSIINRICVKIKENLILLNICHRETLKCLTHYSAKEIGIMYPACIKWCAK